MVNENVVVPERVKTRLIASVPKFKRILLDLRKDTEPEVAVVMALRDMFEEVFGFNKYEEVKHEVRAGIKRGVRKTDIVIVSEEEIHYAVEVKAAHVELTAAFVKKAEEWAIAKGVVSFVLTNGIEWQIRSISKKESSGDSLVNKFDFTEINPKKEADQQKLYMLCKRGVKQNLIKKAAQFKNVMNCYVIGAVLKHSSVLKEVRKNMKKISPGLKVDIDEIQNIVVEEVLRGDTIKGEYAEEAEKKVKKALDK